MNATRCEKAPIYTIRDLFLQFQNKPLDTQVHIVEFEDGTMGIATWTPDVEGAAPGFVPPVGPIVVRGHPDDPLSGTPAGDGRPSAVFDDGGPDPLALTITPTELSFETANAGAPNNA